ncbi:MAG TPA: sugar ABC transporter permease, partial [Solirubrobacteraceae bacterium]|nr:sugar ABC transporter permease [Solirubrobacteraceae bacterium]
MSAHPPAAAAADAPALERPQPGLVRRFTQGDLASLRVVVGLAVIWIVFEIQNDRFLSAVNLTNLMLQITATGLISVGVVYVLLLGEIDLSVGAVSGLAAAVMAVLNVKHGWSPYPAILGGALTGTVIGLVQGALFTRFGIPSFVVTLAGLLAWQGALLYVLGETGTINLTDPKITGLANTFYPPAIGWVVGLAVIGAYAAATLGGWRRRRVAGLADQQIGGLSVRVAVVAVAVLAVVAILNSDRGVPLAVLILIAFVAGMQYIAARTRFGRHVFAVGGNAEATRRAGIRINHIR